MMSVRLVLSVVVLALVSAISGCGGTSDESGIGTVDLQPVGGSGPGQPPVIVSSPRSVSVPLSGVAEFVVHVSGEGGIHYQWQKNGEDIPYANNDRLTISSVKVADEGVYRVRVWNEYGSVISSQARLDIAAVSSDKGWTSFTPTRLDTSSYSALDLRQPGSRIMYISSSDGDDATGEIYFWDGSKLVDSNGSSVDEMGQPYGNDPFQPSGNIKAFRRWGAVAPRNDGADIRTPWDGSPSTAPGGNRARTRYEYPDWWLFKRGDTFDLNQDLLSWAKETNPNLNRVDGSSLAVSGGRSLTELQVVGAYGSLAKPRPRFVNPPRNTFIYLEGSTPGIKNVAYVSLHFDGRGMLRGRGLWLYQQNSTSDNILIEDCWFDGTTGLHIYKTSAEITIRRSLVTDSWTSNGERVQGIFYGGNRDGVIRIEQSILMRNGFTHGDPELTGWPPSGSQIYDIYSRNMYLSGECVNMSCGVFDTISLIGASGDQFRPGMRIERNFFYQGYLTMGASGGYPDSDGPTGTILDNVFQRFRGSGTNDNRGHPGWGWGLTSGAYKVEMARNILTSAQYSGGGSAYGLSLSALDWYCYNHNFHYPTRENYIHDNIFDSVSSNEVFLITDGEGTNCGYISPGVTNNQIVQNVLINAKSVESRYVRSTSEAPVSHDTMIATNRMFVSRAEAAVALGWPDPNRTLKNYMIMLGYSVTSDDGFLEFYGQAIQQRKGNWRPEFTAKSVVNYIREGFNMPPLQ